MKKLFFVSLLLSTTAFAQTGPGPTPNVWYVCGSGLCLNGVSLSGLLVTNGSSPSTSIAPGSGVATALAVNVGSAGAFITNGGAMGTPASGLGTHITGIPILTGISGLGSGVATALSVNVGSAGAPIINGGALGTPSSGTLTNVSGLPITGVSGLGTGVATALAITPGSSGAVLLYGNAANVSTLSVNGAETLTGSLTVPATHQFYISGGARVQTLTDRVLIGGAAGGGYGYNSSSNTDWWDLTEKSLAGGIGSSDAIYSQLVVEFDSSSTVLNATPNIAIAGAVQSYGTITNATPRALEYAAYANNPSYSISTWGIYGESNYFYNPGGSGSGMNVFGYENEVRAWNPVAIDWTPYHQDAPGLTGMVLGCGSGRWGTYSCTDALYITSNPNTFGAGIIFLDGSVGQIATGGSTIGAIEMPHDYQIQWYESGTSIGASISGDASGNLDVATNGTGGHLKINGNQVYCGIGATVTC